MRYRPPTTKLYPPSTDATLLERPELVDSLIDLAGRKLAAVTAPSGSGKSTLLAQACRRLAGQGWQTAWLTLDRFDDEPRRFALNLLAAFGQMRPGFAEALVASVAAAGTVVLSEVMDGLIAECSALPASDPPIALFLDDCQVLERPEVLTAIGYLVQYSDARMHLILASQRELPLGIARLKARGAVIDLGFAELRLAGDEIRDYLTRIQRMALDDADIRSLADQTEGWISGLQLAAIAWRQAGRTTLPPGPTAAGFADALLDEILAHQPPATRAFLLDTALLDEFCVPLCDAITGRGDAIDQIEALERSSLFIIRLDREHIWFRYHHLFQHYLRRHKAAQGQAAVRPLMVRASRWFADNGMPADALRTALAAPDQLAAVDILERWGRTLLRQGDFKTLNDALQAIGREGVHASIRLSVLDAWTALYLGNAIAAGESLDLAERLGAAEPGRAGLGAEIRLVRAMCGVTRYDRVDADASHADLATAFGPEDGLMRAWAQVVLGYTARADGRQTAARRHFVEAIRIADSNDDLVVSLMARYNRAIVDLLVARPDLALAGLRQWLDDPAHRRWQRAGSSAFLLAASGIAHTDRLEYGAAEKVLDVAIDRLSQTQTFAYLDIARVLRARVLAATGRCDAALTELAAIVTAAGDRPPDRVLFRAAIARARTLIDMGSDDVAVRAALTEAEQVLIASGQWQRAVPTENAAQYDLAVCHRLARIGADQELLARARHAADVEEGLGRVRHRIEFLSLAALAAWRTGDRRAAGRDLATALRLAMPGAAYGPIAAVGQDLLAIVLTDEADGQADAGGDAGAGAGAGAGTAGLDDARRAAFRHLAVPEAGDVGDRPVHGLHRRELQILALVGQGLRNREIGERLHIGEETVKWYLKRTYEALGVRNRAHALARARELGLV